MLAVKQNIQKLSETIVNQKTRINPIF